MFWLLGSFEILCLLSSVYARTKAMVSCSFFKGSSEVITISSLLSSAGTGSGASLSSSAGAFLGSTLLVFRVIAIGALCGCVWHSSYDVAEIVELFVLHYGGLHVLREYALGAALFGVGCAGGDEADHEEFECFGYRICQ